LDGPPPWLVMAEEESPHRTTELSHDLPIYKADSAADTLYFCANKAAVLEQRLLRPST